MKYLKRITKTKLPFIRFMTVPCIVFIFMLLLGVLPGTDKEIFALFEPPYEEVVEPALNIAEQAMRSHQIQWNNYMLYTMNVDTPGYIETGLYGYNEGGKIRSMPFKRWRPGPPDETFKELDFYIDSEGKGFFVVQLVSGVGFTMDGRFKLDRNRKLVTLAGGFPVLGERGEIIVPLGSEIIVTKGGFLYVDGDFVDQFKIAVFKNFADMQALESINGSVFYLREEVALNTSPEAYGIRQGFIVQNNVLKALIGDMKFVKHTYEGSARVVKALARNMKSAAQMVGN